MAKKKLDFRVQQFILESVKYKQQHDDCVMCGEAKATVQIWNPNVFPGNDEKIPDHIWDVCKTCEELIEKTYLEESKERVNEILAKVK